MKTIGVRKMKRKMFMLMCICLAAALSYADTTIFSEDFESYALGTAPYGSNFNGQVTAGGGATGAIVEGNGGKAYQISATIPGAGWVVYGITKSTPVTGNTSTNLADYTIECDFANISGAFNPMDSWNIEVDICSGGGNHVGYIYHPTVSAYQADGYLHMSVKLSDFSGNWWNGSTGFDITSSPLYFEFKGTQNGSSGWPLQQVIAFDNLKLSMAQEPNATNPNPTNGESDVSVSTNLSWDAPTAYTPTSYDVYFGTNPTAHSNPQITVDTNSYDPPGYLAIGTAYYWAVDSNDAGTIHTGNDWSFTTLIPNKATNPNPTNGESNVSVSTNLSWDAPTAYTPTSYEVFLGTNPTASENPGYIVETNEFQPAGPLDNETIYYWDVVAYDGMTPYASQTWSFTTMSTGMPEFTNDNIINFNDFAKMAAEWLSCDNPLTDVTGDGCVNMRDLKVLIDKWLYERPVYNKPRVINITDLGADPDDLMSLVRMLVTANEYDIEGIIASTSCWKTTQDTSNMNNLLNPRLDAYGQVLSNLQKHANGYPTLAYLQSISVLGQSGFGMAAVGDGKDSAGSNLIIAAVDKNDPRPVWVNLWGGGNTVAQALWKVKNTRTQAQVDQFVSKLRVYDILGQDDAGAWMTKTFPNLLYIRFKGVYNWQPSDSWVDTNVQNHGPLGAQYPDRVWAIEGDTPAFLYQYPNGLSDPEHVDWGGWGGRMGSTKIAGSRGMTGGASYDEAQYDPYYMYGDASEGGSSIGRWSTAINNDFAARMDWSITGTYSGANHHLIAVVNGNTTKEILQVSASAGSNVSLSAAGSSDPDGDALTYSWYFYDEPSSYNGTVTVLNNTTASPTVQIPSSAGGKTIHVILELHDNGSPNLYAYRRVIINVN